jgi:transposase
VAELPAAAGRRAARAARLGRGMARWRALAADITAVDGDLTGLLAGTDGQILTTLPGVATSRAAAFAALSLPIARFPNAEHRYSATGLAPASYQSASLNRRGRISRQGLPEHRDALMSLAWGLSQHCGVFIERHDELRPRHAPDPGPGGPRPARLPTGLHAAEDPTTLRRTALPSSPAPERAVTAATAMPHDGAT